MITKKKIYKEKLPHKILKSIYKTIKNNYLKDIQQKCKMI